MRRLFTYLLAFVSTICYSQKSPFNNLVCEIDSSGNYSFIVSGHFYGNRGNKSGFPANTLLANLDWINEEKPGMLICLGDLFMDVSNDIPNYKRSLFDKLEVPLFNAVGNHDLTDNIYQDNFGETWFSFQLGNDLHIFLDTESENGDIEGDQLTFFKEQIDYARKQNLSNVFVYAHRTIWKDTYSEMEGLFTGNTQSIITPNFESEVLPELQKISSQTNVYWFAGSLGPAPASFFHFKDDNNITYIATAIRALSRDAVLRVRVRNGVVSFETKSFTGQELKELKEYDIELWKNTVGEEPFNWRLVGYYIQLMFTHRYFWYGIAFASSGLLLLSFFRRKWKAGK